jgi:hypothetical protein
MSNLTPIEADGEIIAYYFECPGCGLAHAPYIKPHKNSVGASWYFNGDIEKPTFSPSIMSKVEYTEGKVSICHLYITSGKIHFLEDSTHTLAGKVIDL